VIAWVVPSWTEKVHWFRIRSSRCSDSGFRSVEGAETWGDDLYDDNNQMMFNDKTNYQRVVEISNLSQI
jgi:hypothetical protein